MNMKPCPFCGSTQIIITGKEAFGKWMKCNSCCAKGPSGNLSLTQAMDEWNKRPTCETCENGEPYNNPHPCSMDKDCIRCLASSRKPIYEKDFSCSEYSKRLEVKE